MAIASQVRSEARGNAVPPFGGLFLVYAQRDILSLQSALLRAASTLLPIPPLLDTRFVSSANTNWNSGDETAEAEKKEDREDGYESRENTRQKRESDDWSWAVLSGAGDDRQVCIHLVLRCTGPRCSTSVLSPHLRADEEDQNLSLPLSASPSASAFSVFEAARPSETEAHKSSETQTQPVGEKTAGRKRSTGTDLLAAQLEKKLLQFRDFLLPAKGALGDVGSSPSRSSRDLDELDPWLSETVRSRRARVSLLLAPKSTQKPLSASSSLSPLAAVRFSPSAALSFFLSPKLNDPEVAFADALLDRFFLLFSGENQEQGEGRDGRVTEELTEESTREERKHQSEEESEDERAEGQVLRYLEDLFTHTEGEVRASVLFLLLSQLFGGADPGARLESPLVSPFLRSSAVSASHPLGPHEPSEKKRKENDEQRFYHAFLRIWKEVLQRELGELYGPTVSIDAVGHQATTAVIHFSANAETIIAVKRHAMLPRSSLLQNSSFFQGLRPYEILLCPGHQVPSRSVAAVSPYQDLLFLVNLSRVSSQLTSWVPGLLQPSAAPPTSSARPSSSAVSSSPSSPAGASPALPPASSVSPPSPSPAPTGVLPVFPEPADAPAPEEQDLSSSWNAFSPSPQAEEREEARSDRREGHAPEQLASSPPARRGRLPSAPSSPAGDVLASTGSDEEASERWNLRGGMLPSKTHRRLSLERWQQGESLQRDSGTFCLSDREENAEEKNGEKKEEREEVEAGVLPEDPGREEDRVGERGNRGKEDTGEEEPARARIQLTEMQQKKEQGTCSFRADEEETGPRLLAAVEGHDASIGRSARPELSLLSAVLFLLDSLVTRACANVCYGMRGETTFSRGRGRGPEEEGHDRETLGVSAGAEEGGSTPLDPQDGSLAEVAAIPVRILPTPYSTPEALLPVVSSIKRHLLFPLSPSVPLPLASFFPFGSVVVRCSTDPRLSESVDLTSSTQATETGDFLFHHAFPTSWKQAGSQPSSPFGSSPALWGVTGEAGRVGTEGRSSKRGERETPVLAGQAAFPSVTQTGFSVRGASNRGGDVKQEELQEDTQREGAGNGSAGESAGHHGRKSKPGHALTAEGEAVGEVGTAEASERQDPSEVESERKERGEEKSKFDAAGTDGERGRGPSPRRWRTPASLAGLLRERPKRSDSLRDE
uniref:Glutamic acid-rich protein, putative n=1 Tax=Neospora caninum (strain Liverpool) TaxID=572307 RepID=A0A0F7U9P1_NEOCL|nr:TPA: glutamic acid-rich protein, putative [Neospora caninum Liverpool]